MSQLPDPQSLVALADAFEQLRGSRPDPEEAPHRRSLERMVLQLAGVSVLGLLTVSSWIAVDPTGRYQAEQRQQGLQALGAITASLVGAVAGYAARPR